MSVIRAVSVVQVTMPMPWTFGHARAARDTAENVVVVADVEGVEGLGESVPREYVTGETPAGVLEAIARLDVAALDAALAWSDFAAAVRSIERLALPARLGAPGRPALAAACAVELALLDAAGKRFGVPLRELAGALELPVALRQERGRRHPVSRAFDFTQTPEEFFARWGSAPLPHVKVKVGLDPATDVARVAEVRRRLGAGVPLCVDANMAWSLEQAREMVERLRPFEVAWYEEPLAKGALADCRALRERTGARLMLDESLCSLADGEAAVSERACDLFNIRISKCGGLIPSLRLIAFGAAHGIGFQVGGQVGQLGIIVAAGRQLMGAVRGAVAYEGGGVLPYREQVVIEDLSVAADHHCGDLPGPGLGVTADHAVLARHAIRRARWGDGGHWSITRGEETP